jgi:hypothetical protein
MRPLVQSRMKEAHNFSGSRIDGCYVGSLVAIAEYAAQGQIVRVGTAAVFPAYDVVQLMGEGRPRFRIQTILATRFRASADLLP